MRAAAAAYTLLDGTSTQIAHHGRPITACPGEPVTRPIPPAPDQPQPAQPPEREPARRRPPRANVGPGTSNDQDLSLTQ
ncbi:MAG: hypothetical protein ACR2MP_03015 [Streptosporangiaceae bacterium]